MAENLNATCNICNTKYHLCKSCSSAKTFMPWRMVCCSIDCYKVYMTLSSYTNGKCSKIEAKEMLDKCNLSNIKQFNPAISSAITEICKNDTLKKKNKRTLSESYKTELNDNIISDEISTTDNNIILNSDLENNE